MLYIELYHLIIPQTTSGYPSNTLQNYPKISLQPHPKNTSKKPSNLSKKPFDRVYSSRFRDPTMSGTIHEAVLGSQYHQKNLGPKLVEGWNSASTLGRKVFVLALLNSCACLLVASAKQIPNSCCDVGSQKWG